jgi:hypothetical protein
LLLDQLEPAMKNLIAAAVLSVTCLAQPSFAQSAAAPDRAAVAAAQEMLDSMNYRTMAKGIFGQMRQAMPAMMKQASVADINGNPAFDPARKQAEIAKLDADMAKSSAQLDAVFNDPGVLDAVMQNTATLYARHYSAEELHQIAAFYKSPVGAKMLATMPQMMGESMQMTQEVIMPRIRAVMKQTRPAQ